MSSASNNTGRMNFSDGFFLILGLLFVLGIALYVALLLLCGICGLLILAWPWCLLLIPGSLAVGLAIRPKLRKTLAAAFRKDTRDAEELSFRNKLIVTLVVGSGLSSLACAGFAGSHRLEWWLIPLVLLTIGLRLQAMTMSGRPHASRLLSIFIKNAVEFLTVTTLVVAVYWILLISFRSSRPELISVGKLSGFEKASNASIRDLKISNANRTLSSRV